MNTLFRTESYSGSGVRDAVNVLTYEIAELLNTDILDYCLQHYDLKRKHFDSTLHTLINTIEDGCNVEVEDIREISRALLEHIEMSTGHAIRYALWLTSKESVLNNYDGEDDEIDSYECGPVILSDLGEDGILFGYETMPQKIKL